MTTNQLDILSAIMTQTELADGNYTIKEWIGFYNGIRKAIAEANEELENESVQKEES